MNKILTLLSICVCGFSYSQEKLIPLTINPYLENGEQLTKSGNSIDSTFQAYTYTNLDLPVRDDFSTNKFVDYNIGFIDAGVTSTQYFQLMDSGNLLPLAANSSFCDSTHAHHDMVVVNGGVVEVSSSYFATGVDVYVNDLKYSLEKEHKVTVKIRKTIFLIIIINL